MRASGRISAASGRKMYQPGESTPGVGKSPGALGARMAAREKIDASGIEDPRRPDPGFRFGIRCARMHKSAGTTGRPDAKKTAWHKTMQLHENPQAG